MRLPPDRKYYEHYEKPGTEGVPVRHRVYCCPCCGYPTVGEPPSYEICTICSWEDDDCDDGGANGDYSLEEARQNFRLYLTMHRATHEGAPQLQRAGYKNIHDWELKPDKLERKRRLMAQLDRYMAEIDLHLRGEIWEKFIEMYRS